MELTVRQVSENVHEYRAKFESAGDIHIAHLSDVHYDSIECDRDLLTKHLRSLEGKFGFVVINGDWFDAMQGRYDPRGSKSAIRPEYKHSRYLDMIVEDSVEYLSQFNLCYHLNIGNHCESILRRLETDILARLVDGLNSKGIKAQKGAYSGYIVLRHSFHNGTRFHATATQTTWYHHGYGGNSARSKGILSADIDTMQNPSADVIVKGHDHQSWYLPISVKELAQNLEIKEKLIHHIRTGSYKKPTISGRGWEVEKGFNMTTMGGWLMTNSFCSGIPQLKTKVTKL